MTDLAADIAGHYAAGGLFERIVAGLLASGVTPEEAAPDDLKLVDEFHIGGRAATEALLAQVDIAPGDRVLDIGSGIGGAARFIAERTGAAVHGVDLTPEFVETARRLCDLVGVAATFQVGSALDLPVESGAFDAATLIHVGMNIADKPRLFAEAARALRPGGVFAVYDVMRTADGDLAYPLPWAADESASFVDAPETYRAAARAAGFEVAAERDRGDFARAFFARSAGRNAKDGPPPAGLQLIMGADAALKIRNMVVGLDAGRIAPVEMICRLNG